MIKKYIDQNGGKSQFALSEVALGGQINPAFPLVKVGQKDFQLIPVQDCELNYTMSDKVKFYFGDMQATLRLSKR